MSDNINDKRRLWLIGAGIMAMEYAKVLQAQKIDFEVIGRGVQSAREFQERTGKTVITGGIESYLHNNKQLPAEAIVAVGVEKLASTTIELLQKGVKRILVEKPAGLNLDEIQQVREEAEKHKAEVYVAYNRRYYSSVLCAKQLIEEDGGVTSFNFEFTEWSHMIEPLSKAAGVKENWFLANSTHVVDMAFFLGGKPKVLSSYVEGGLSWHPTASIFAGAGISENGALFSYQANWSAPGRWAVEVLTARHRYIFRPLEQLHVQKIGSVATDPIKIDASLDEEYKPGLYKQVQAFIEGQAKEYLMPIDEHYHMVNDVYSVINYGSLKLR